MQANYSEVEVRAMLAHYQELAEARDVTPRRMKFLVLLADLDNALGFLTNAEWEVVLLYGLLGLPLEHVGRLLHISHQAVSKRFRKAVENVLIDINGGD